MRSTFAALHQRNFRIWICADLVSVTGRWMQTLAISWLVLRLTGSTTQLGFNLMLQALPVLLLSSWAGSLADRFPGRRLLFFTQAAHASLSICLAMFAWHHAGGMAVIYAISVIAGVVSAIEGPTLGRFTSSTVDAETLGNALSLSSLSNSAGRIIGMSLGGVAVALLGPAPLFAANATGFVAVIVALFLIRTHKPVELAVAEKRGVREGFKYLFTQPVVLITLALATVLGSLGRNYQVTMAAMANGPLHAGAAGYGMLSTIFAVGTVVGGFLAARQRRLGYPTLIVAGTVASCFQLFAGLSGGMWTFASVILPIAAAAVLVDTTVSTRVQLDTRGDMRGRVLAALAMTSSLSSALGAQLLGWMSQTVGPRTTLVMAGLVTTAACIAAAIALSRRVETPLLPSAGRARELLVGVRTSAASGRLAVSGRLAASRRLMARRLVAPGRALSGRLAVVPGRRSDRSTGPRLATRSSGSYRSEDVVSTGVRARL